MTPDHTIPPQLRSVATFHWRGVLGALVVFIAVNWCGTQYAAHHLDYQEALGKPLVSSQQRSLYPPWGVWVWTFRTVFRLDSDPEVRWSLYKGVMIAGSSLIVTPLFLMLAQYLRIRNMARDAKHLHGSAKWATDKDVRRSGLLSEPHGVYLGQWGNRYLRHNGQDHVLIVAPTRAGKGVGNVLPTLLGSWFQSVVAYDIKGELWEKTAGFRSTLGPCFRFAPTTLNSSRFNPLAEVRLKTRHEIADVQNIAIMLVKQDASSTEPHWHLNGAALLEGLMLHVLYAADKEGRVASLADVNDLLSIPGQSFQVTLVMIMEYKHLPAGTHPFIAKRANGMIEKDEREFAGVHSVAKTALSIYEDPALAQNTAASDFSVSDLVNFAQPVSLYIVVPPSHQERLRPLVRVIFTLIVARLCEKMAADSNKHRLLLLIDEFPTLENMELFQKALAYMAGYGIKAMLIAQDISQIEQAYGEKQSIVANCNARVGFCPNTWPTARLFSDMLGQQTVLRESHSFSGGRFSPLQSRMSTSMDHTVRPLMTPDELLRLPGPLKEGQGANERIVAPGQTVIFQSGRPPILAAQMLYFADPVLCGRALMAPPVNMVVIENGAIVLQPSMTRKPLPLLKPPPKPARKPPADQTQTSLHFTEPEEADAHARFYPA